MIDCLHHREPKRPIPWWKDLMDDVKYHFIPNIKRGWRKLFPNKKQERFASLIFPVIKNMSKTDAIDKIMAIQPMKGPASQVFYLDYMHTKKRWWQYWKKN